MSSSGSVLQFRTDVPLGSAASVHHYDISLSGHSQEVKERLSNLPLNPPSTLRSMDAFADSLFEGISDAQSSLEIALFNWPDLYRGNQALWQSLMLAFGVAFDGAARSVQTFSDEGDAEFQRTPHRSVRFQSDHRHLRGPDTLDKAVFEIGFERRKGSIEESLYVEFDSQGCVGPEQFGAAVAEAWGGAWLESARVTSWVDLKILIRDRVARTAVDQVCLQWNGRRHSRGSGSTLVETEYESGCRFVELLWSIVVDLESASLDESELPEFRVCIGPMSRPIPW